MKSDPEVRSQRTRRALNAVQREATQSSVIVGHHKASWPAEVDVLSPIRRARRLQSIRRRLAA